MPTLGYHLSSEEHEPNDLVQYAQQAEERGFEFALISDHYHPWVEQQGESPFVWSTLGGIAQVTDEIRVGTGVTCPTMRYHPAIIAQATATVANMFDDRFFFGIGTGERLNEHVEGHRWPPHHVRIEMLEEAVEIIRELWTGDMHSYDGYYYTVENAQVFTLPDETPPIYAAASGPKAAAAVADFGEGFISTAPKQELVQVYENNGGSGPKYGMMHVCVSESTDEAKQTVKQYWPNTAVPNKTELAVPKHFEKAAEKLSVDQMVEHIPLGNDPQNHIDMIQQYEDAGFDHVWVHQIGQDQDAFFQFHEEHILPEFP